MPSHTHSIECLGRVCTATGVCQQQKSPTKTKQRRTHHAHRFSRDRSGSQLYAFLTSQHDDADDIPIRDIVDNLYPYAWLDEPMTSVLRMFPCNRSCTVSDWQG